jgi:hypothetical protein
MEMSGQHYASAALPLGAEPSVTFKRKFNGPIVIVGMMGKEISVPTLEVGLVSSGHVACSLVDSLSYTDTFQSGVINIFSADVCM